jgi:hypothetical protein
VRSLSTLEDEKTNRIITLTKKNLIEVTKHGAGAFLKSLNQLMTCKKR